MESSRAPDSAGTGGSGNGAAGVPGESGVGSMQAGEPFPETGTDAVKGEDRFEVEERFRILVSAVTEYAIYMLDPQGRVVTWNPGAERSKGYRAEEVLGRNFSMFFRPDDVEAGVPAEELAAAAR